MLRELITMPAGQIVKREPVRATEDTLLGEVVERMRTQHRGAVLVESATGKLIGVFTEKDVATRLDHSTLDWRKTPVSEVMTRVMVALKEDAKVVDALNIMTEHKLRHVPLVDDTGRGGRILSARDILVHITEAYPAEFVNLPSEPTRSVKKSWGG